MSDITLTLLDPTTRADLSAVTADDIASLNIYRADGEDGAPALVGQADPKANPITFVDSSLTPGTYVYTASAVGSDGRESKHGDPFPVTIAAAAALLNPPTISEAKVSA